VQIPSKRPSELQSKTVRKNARKYEDESYRRKQKNAQSVRFYHI